MTKTRVEDKEVLLSETLLIPDDKEAIIEALLFEHRFVISIRFESGIDPKTGRPTGSWTLQDGDPNLLKMSFKGWIDRIGTLTKPHKIADIYGTTFGFMMVTHRVSNINVAQIQFLGGGVYE